jgi:SAM-dependent methyltransferase
MLTCDYDRLGLERGDLVLDLGCGFGRHAYEAGRRGADVVALDAGLDECEGVASVFTAMVEAGEIDPDIASIAAVQGDGYRLPFADATFDRVICSEVLEHLHRDDVAMGELARVLRPGGTMAVTVPRFGPELVNWALSDEYHAVKGGHIRIYRRRQLLARLRACGLEVTGTGHAHGLHSPYWWLRCLVGTTNEDHVLVRAYHGLLVKDIVEHPRSTRLLDAVLSPLIGKSIVVYLRRPTVAAHSAAPIDAPLDARAAA